MASYKVRIGNVEVLSLSDNTPEFPAANVFPKVSESDWKKYPDALTVEKKLKTNFGCFLARSQGKTILVDTGIGAGFPGRLMADMRDKGVNPMDVSIVAFTHLHSDHIGWCVAQEAGKSKLLFPNAKYWVPEGDWDHYTKADVLANSPAVKSQVLPLKDLGALKLIEGGAALTSEITSVSTPGHTLGHTRYAISSGGEKGFILGDVFNFPFQVSETAWEIAFDFDKALGRKTREAILDRLEKDKATVGAGHLLPPSLGKIVRTGSRRYWQGL